MALRPAWRLARLEVVDASPFGWHSITKDKLLEIRSKLADFESMSLSEILGRNSHVVSRSGICKQAQARLKAIKLDDTDELLSLRLSGPERVWGILDNNTVLLLWWDPNHQVWPTSKK